MRGLLEKIEPTLGPEDDAYRQHFLPVDRARAVGSFTLVLILMAAVWALEATYLDGAQFLRIAIVRILFFAFSFYIYTVTRGPVTPATLDRSSLLWSMAFSLQLAVLMYLRPASRADDVGMMLLIIAIYSLSPASLFKRILPSAVLTVGYSLALTLVRDVSL